MASIAAMIRLICRMVVFETLFWMGCKSAKMSVMGFLCEFWSWRTSTILQKALLAYLIFGEGIGLTQVLIGNRMLLMHRLSYESQL